MTTALEAISREPQLRWMSAQPRAPRGRSRRRQAARVISVVDDAAILVHAEHESAADDPACATRSSTDE